MSVWRAGWSAMRATTRASRRATDSVIATTHARRASTLPRQVARRGYLAPNDASAPPGIDVRDYRGLVGARSACADGQMPRVSLGRDIDLRAGTTGDPVRVPLSLFLQHAAIVAPPGKGKTYGVITPLAIRILRAGASVVVLDVTGDLTRHLQEYSNATRASGAGVQTIEWSVHPQRAATSSWNPLQGVNPSDLVAIEGLKSAIAGEAPADPKHQDFHDRDLGLLGDLIVGSLRSMRNPTLADLATAMADEALFDRITSGLATVPWDEVRECWTLRNKLRAFAQPVVAARMSTSTFDIEHVCVDHTLAIVGAELDLKTVSRATSALFVNRLIGHMQSRYGHSSRPVIFIVDEAPVIAKQIRLESLLATGRAMGAGVILACQNVTQFGSDAEQSTIFDSCDMMILLPGASETSLRRFQSRLGERDVDRTSMVTDVAARLRTVQLSRSSERLPMVGSRELVAPPFGRYPAFVHSRSLHERPFVVDLDRTSEFP